MTKKPFKSWNRESVTPQSLILVIFLAMLNMNSALVFLFLFLSTVFHRKVLSSHLPILQCTNYAQSGLMAVESLLHAECFKQIVLLIIKTAPVG